MNDEVARNLFRFLHDEGVRYCVITDNCATSGEVFIAVDRPALSGLSGRFTRFARSENVLLIQFDHGREECEARLAWIAHGEVRHLRIAASASTYVGGVRLWRARHLLTESLAALDAHGKPRGYFVPPPAAGFLHEFLNCINDGELESPRMERACLRFSEDSAGAEARLKAIFNSTEVAAIARAMENKEWETLRGQLPRLRARIKVRGFVRRAFMKVRRVLVRPRGMLIAFIGAQGSEKIEMIERINTLLAPVFAAPPRGRLKGIQDSIGDRAALIAMKFRTRLLGQTIVSARAYQRIVQREAKTGRLTEPDLWLVLDASPDQSRTNDASQSLSTHERDQCLAFAARLKNAVILDAGKPLQQVATNAITAILELATRHTASRSRFTGVQSNRFCAKLLLFCCRCRIPMVSSLIRTVFNSEIDCPIRLPVYLPYPYGIFIHANAEIGSGVTVMQQVTIGVKSLEDVAGPSIDDDVFIGAGAKVLGAIKVGQGAVIGANAVVTRNVPKLATVAGVNRLIHAPSAPPGDETIRLIEGLKAVEGLDLQLAPPERRKANHDV